MSRSMTVLELAYQLTQAGEAFVLATVVWCDRPTSAKPGAQAIIQADGQMIGWIGGSCAQPTVVREALRVLREGGEPYLMRLGAAEMGSMRDEVRVFPMTCVSGGALDIFMEPHFPPPQILLIGDSPVIVALSRLAPVLDFAVTELNSPDLSQLTVQKQTSILVATHGQYDEDALEQALRSPAAYVGMVGSRKRGEACRAYLRDSGLTESQIARLKVPAGLDLGAVTPEEIAASILAELVQVRRGAMNWAPTEQPQENSNGTGVTAVVTRRDQSGPNAETAIDPVCGMTVQIAGARHHSVYDSRDFYFCCPACKRLFERNPQEYLVQHER